MDFEDGMEVIHAAQKAVTEEHIFQRWIPYQSIIGYQEFARSLGTAETVYSGNDGTAEEILAKVKGIMDGDF